MHLFVISVRVLFNANLIKGRILVIAPLHSSPCAPPPVLVPSPSYFFLSVRSKPPHPNTHIHTPTHTHTDSFLSLKEPAIGQRCVDCFNKSSNQILSQLMQM